MDTPQRPPTPLAAFKGEPVPVPAWFARALETPVETGVATHDGARLAWKAWGERGAPAIVLIHGGTAHNGWWDAIGPHLAASGRRVVAPDLLSMGGSDWLEQYTMAIHAAAALSAAEAGGAFEAGAPHMFGHSFGGFVALTAALHHGDRLKGAALLDSPIRAPQEQREGSPPRRGGKVYPDLASALARFRLLPEQPCENLWLVDHVARGSLKAVEGGFTWKFDPGIWAKLTYERRDPEHAAKNAKCPLAFVRGADSALCNDEIWAFMRSTFTRSAFLSVPDAQHHLILDQPLASAAVLETLAETWPG